MGSPIGAERKQQMITDDYNLLEVLAHIDCAACDYEQWLTVGMALKTEGYTCDDWESWSKTDPGRYHNNECPAKWGSFRRNEATAGSLIKIAIDQGWTPEQKTKGQKAYAWDDPIPLVRDHRQEEKKAVDPNWVQPMSIPAPPKEFVPTEQIKQYLQALFAPNEYVGITLETYQTDDGIHKPTKGMYSRTAKELIQRLDKYKYDIGYALGDYNLGVGGWIRFNPLDGKGVSDTNVTAYRYALVESDKISLEKQYALLTALKLPIRVLVHSGNKSLHAIVHIGAPNYEEYRKRVDYLYKVCQESGLEVDKQDRNPSRLSRLPGLMRQGKPQYIIAENIGMASWDKWVDYIDNLNDDLPDIETFADIKELPDLAPELVESTLRVGHKLLLSGPSKAGKSYALIQLAIAIAEGGVWFGRKCKQGRVLYVNLEVDDASCKHRIDAIYRKLGNAQKSHNLDIWTLRGTSIPLDKLAPKMVRRAKDRKYIAVIIDPLYKVLTGDENSAEQMAAFCNLFDWIARQLKASVIYCHHHSKGAQGGKKSMDRASGSGVFARDPDAIIDMIEIPLSENQKTEKARYLTDELVCNCLDHYLADWRKESDEKIKSAVLRKAYAINHLQDTTRDKLCSDCIALETEITKGTAWRIESTLREFEPYKTQYVYFCHPLHKLMPDDLFKHNKPAGAEESKADKEAQKRSAKQEKMDAFENAVENANMGEPPTKEQVAKFLGISIRQVERYVQLSDIYFYDTKDKKIKKSVEI